MNQRDVVHYGYSQTAQIITGRCFEEIFVSGAEYIRFADYGGQHDNDVIDVADGRNDERVEGH